jgi:hypothetical protein
MGWFSSAATVNYDARKTRGEEGENGVRDTSIGGVMADSWRLHLDQAHSVNGRDAGTLFRDKLHPQQSVGCHGAGRDGIALIKNALLIFVFKRNFGHEVIVPQNVEAIGDFAKVAEVRQAGVRVRLIAPASWHWPVSLMM